MNTGTPAAHGAWTVRKAITPVILGAALYAFSLAKTSGQDGPMFRTALPWQVAQLCAVAILTAVLLRLWR